jgi:hypothetical protein
MGRRDQALRLAFVAGSIVLILLAAGYLWQMPWAIVTWPWPDGRLSYTFVASILAAIAAAALWIGVTGELGAAAAGALNVLVIAVGMTWYLGSLALGTGRPALLPYTLVIAIAALVSLWLFWWSRRIAIHDPRPTPRPVLVAFGLFVAILLAAGSALLLRVPTIFPWPLKPESSVMFGLIFIGDAFYFLYALLSPRWHNAKAQLLSFLAYDLVLLPVFIPHIATVQPAHRLSLMIYLGVLAGSCLLALYHLFADPTTRFGRRSPSRPVPSAEGRAQK